MEDYRAIIRNTFELGSVRDANLLFEACIHNAFPTFNFRGLELVRFLREEQYLEGKSGTGEFISEILKQRLDSGRKTVIISDRTMECQVQKIPAFSESLRKCHCADTNTATIS